MATAPGHTSFNITLPDEIIETMMSLAPTKIYGANRAEIARALIYDCLKRMHAERIVRLPGLPNP